MPKFGPYYKLLNCMDPQYKARYQNGKFRAKRNMNARKGAPRTNAPSSEITIGTIIEYAGWVENGEVFKGVAKWFFDATEENFFWAGNCEDVESVVTPIKIEPQIDTVEIVKKDEGNKRPLKLIHKQHYGPISPEVIAIRDYIEDEFHHKTDGSNLQCTEYAYYRLKCAGINVEWKQKINRHGGLWPDVVASKYRILKTPVVGGVICVPLSIIAKTGHIAYVEKTNPDQSIDISEANWGPSPNDLGYYWERTLSPSKWRNYYKATFIDFNI